VPEQTPSSGSTPPLRLLPRQEDLAEAGTSFIESLRLAWSGLQQAAARAAAAVEEGFAWIEGHRDEIREFWNAARARIDSDWRYLLDLVDPGTAIMVVLALEARDRYDERFETSVEDLLERGLLDAELIQEIRSGVSASELPAAQKKQLDRALDDLVAEDYEIAVLLLINPLEGAFWRLATQRGLIERNQKGKWMTTPATGRGCQIDGVEKLLPLPDLNLPPAFLQYVRALAYGGTGHPFRHGTADEGWRLRALFLLTALLGWLETVGLLDAQRAVRAAFFRQIDDRAALSRSRPA
jgi:hypothetical protein